MTLGGKRGNPKAGFPLFPPSLEIAPRFPHSHRHDYGFILVQAINYTPLNCHPCCRAKVLPMSPAAPQAHILRACFFLVFRCGNATSPKLTPEFRFRTPAKPEMHARGQFPACVHHSRKFPQDTVSTGVTPSSTHSARRAPPPSCAKVRLGRAGHARPGFPRGALPPREPPRVRRPHS